MQSSPAPGAPQTARKAWVAGLLSALTTGLATFAGLYYGPSAMQLPEALIWAVVAGLGASGFVAGPVWAVPNKAK